MDRITSEQVRRNREARLGWDLYQHHRERVTWLLLDSAAPNLGTLCVLGAGNCNDLDLRRLRQAFQSIHLVDVDAEALSLGCQLQGVSDDPGIHRVGGVDVTGIAARLANWSPQKPASADDVEPVLRDSQSQTIPGLPAGQFDVVASVGLLTQLIEMVDVTLGDKHPQFLPLMTAVRLRHLRLLLELTRPGGKAWLFVEVVSSVSCPELLTTTDAGLVPILQQALARQNFFTGANPVILSRLFQQDPVLGAQTELLQLTDPWLWTFFTRTYAVCAFSAKKRLSEATAGATVPG